MRSTVLVNPPAVVEAHDGEAHAEAKDDRRQVRHGERDRDQVELISFYEADEERQKQHGQQPRQDPDSRVSAGVTQQRSGRPHQ